MPLSCWGYVLRIFGLHLLTKSLAHMGRSIMYFVAVFLLIAPLSWGQAGIYQVSESSVRFNSDAPLEMIKASSPNMVGVVDIAQRTFLFKINIVSFQGFNSPRQKEHFNENYMESDIFPVAIYSGKIIEDVDFSKNGEYDIRSKGKLTIHGVERQRIVKCHISSSNGVISVKSGFSVLLAEYNIKIPRIVSDKLSPEIHVAVDAVLVQKSNKIQ